MPEACTAQPPTVVYTHKRGRPRKLNVRRTPSGKSLGEVVDLAPMFAQPHRRGLPDPSARTAGQALGRLLQRGLISGYQYRAGERWASVVASYRRQLCAPPSSTRSGEMAERVSTGYVSVEAEVREIDPEQAERDRAELKQKYDDCFEGLVALGRLLNRGHAIINSLRKVCIEDRDADENELGDIRLGMNSIGRVLFRKDEK